MEKGEQRRQEGSWRNQFGVCGFRGQSGTFRQQCPIDSWQREPETQGRE